MDTERNRIKNQIAQLLEEHVGADNPILMNEIYVTVTGSHIIPLRRYDQTRLVRTIIKELRQEGKPIAIKSGSRGGYFTARNDNELKSTIETFHRRAMSSLQQEAALKRISFNALLEQYELEISQATEEKEHVA